jgi:hypothetical protein
MTKVQEPLASSAIDDSANSSVEPLTVVPAINSLPVFRSSASLAPIVSDDRAISGLLDLILNRGHISIHEMARRMGCSPSSVRQYMAGRRCKPSLRWFVKFANIAGAKVTIEFPER